jgi:hypothetical protein
MKLAPLRRGEARRVRGVLREAYAFVPVQPTASTREAQDIRELRAALEVPRRALEEHEQRSLWRRIRGPRARAAGEVTLQTWMASMHSLALKLTTSADQPTR